MSGRYIDKIFQSDGAANDFYLDLCEEYKNVKIVEFAPWPDGRCHACFCMEHNHNWFAEKPKSKKTNEEVL